MAICDSVSESNCIANGSVSINRSPTDAGNCSSVTVSPLIPSGTVHFSTPVLVSEICTLMSRSPGLTNFNVPDPLAVPVSGHRDVMV